MSKNKKNIKESKVIRLLFLLAILVVGAVSGQYMKSGVIVKAVTQNEREKNDSYATANTITLGNEISGSISNSGDEDYYKVIPTANGKIELDFCHTYIDGYGHWNISVYRYEDGEYIEVSSAGIDLEDNEKVSIPFIGAVKNATYYIKVERGWGNDIIGERYTVKTKFILSNYYEKELNDAYSSATEIELQKSYIGTINSSADKDYYKIPVSSNGKIELDFCHTYVDGYGHWNVYVYRYEDGEYVEVSSTGIDLEDNEKVSIPFIGAVKSATYYIKVERGWGDGIIGEQYTIQTKFISSDYYEKELNDVYSSATKMELQKSYKGTMNSSADKDYYKIVSPEKGNITVNFNHTYMDKSGYWNVYIYHYTDGQYIELDNKRVYLNDKNTSAAIGFYAVKNGIYYIKVVDSSWGGVVGKNYSVMGKLFANSPTNFNVTSKKNKATLTWSGAKNVTGYEVYYKIGKNGKYKKLASTRGTKYTYKKLSKKRVYYFKVRSYREIGNNKIIYSAYTNVKKAQYK